eukprot:1195539-Prorocentrum_minimum.AAC.5
MRWLAHAPRRGILLSAPALPLPPRLAGVLEGEGGPGAMLDRRLAGLAAGPTPPMVDCRRVEGRGGAPVGPVLEAASLVSIICTLRFTPPPPRPPSSHEFTCRPKQAKPAQYI